MSRRCYTPGSSRRMGRGQEILRRGAMYCLALLLGAGGANWPEFGSGSGTVGADEAGQRQAAAAASPLGRQLDGFRLKDFRGREHALKDFAKFDYLVLAFLGTECPLAKLYTPRLVQLAAEYGPRGVAVIGVNANCQDSVTEIAAHARVHRVEFPILKDLGNELADRLGAQRTPEVFVLDRQRTVRYWGRIDDQFGIGYQREEPRREDLKLALDELLAGKQVSEPVRPSVGCHIGRLRPPADDAQVTYTKDIAPLLEKHCVDCHRKGEIAPFALTDYEEVRGWAEMIAEVVDEGRMPPWHADPKWGEFANARRLSDREKQLLFAWARGGAPRGDSPYQPPARATVEGWHLPQPPDLVIPVFKRPYQVPAEGVVRYVYETSEYTFEEEKWFRAAELRPGNRAVVHHILAFSKQPGEQLRGGARGFLVGYVPGLRSEPYPEGMAKRIPKGSKIVFQMHYTPIGSPQEDLSELGFVFVDPKNVTHEVRTTSALQRRLGIPPGDANYRVTAFDTVPQDVKLLAFMPHMHLRGKSFSYSAEFPDGRRETLLDIPRYDFNWQTAYRLARPRALPQGTKIHCVAHYDNSEDNLNNPDPTKLVRWGDQTFDEMMIGYYDVAIPRDADTGLAEARRIIARMDRNGDGKLQPEEVPRLLRGAFQRVDLNGDRVVDDRELAKSRFVNQ